MNIQIKKIIASGLNSVVYLGKIDDVESIIKIEKMDLYTGNSYMNLLLQSYFQDTVASKFPDKFIQLQMQQIMHNLKIKVPVSSRNYRYDSKYLETFKAVVSGFRPILEKTLCESIPKMSRYQLQFAIEDLCQTLQIMHDHNFAHCDLHWNNIMCNKKKTKWYIIDYGLIKNLTKVTEASARLLKLKDMVELINCFMIQRHFFEHSTDNLADRVAEIKKDTTTYEKICKHLEKLGTAKHELNFEDILIAVVCKLVNYKLYATVFEDVFSIYGIDAKKLKTWKEPYADYLLNILPKFKQDAHIDK